MERKTADDYRRERCTLLKELNALNFRIKKKAHELCDLYPEVKIGINLRAKDCHKIINLTDDINIILTIISRIENYIKENLPYKQAKLF